MDFSCTHIEFCVSYGSFIYRSFLVKAFHITLHCANHHKLEPNCLECVLTARSCFCGHIENVMKKGIYGIEHMNTSLAVKFVAFEKFASKFLGASTVSESENPFSGYIFSWKKENSTLEQQPYTPEKLDFTNHPAHH